MVVRVSTRGSRPVAVVPVPEAPVVVQPAGDEVVTVVPPVLVPIPGPEGPQGPPGVGVVVSATEPLDPEIGTIWVTP